MIDINQLSKEGYPYTDEQKQVFKSVLIDREKIVKIIAFAGTGKTATLAGLSHLFGKHFNLLYLVFGESMKNDALEKFDTNIVDVLTTHALAYRNIIKKGEKIKNKYQAIEIAEIFDIGLSDAWDTIREFEDFCNSDRKIGQKTSKYNRGTHFASKLFEKMDNGEIEKNHSFYLKKFQLNLAEDVYMPALKSYDCIFLDESHDTNEVTLDIFKHLKAKQKVMVGDSHQQIYSFRGSVNAVDKLDGVEVYLTKSFRYNAEIAKHATKYLKVFKNEENEITGLSKQKSIKTLAILSRSNSKLLDGAILYGEKKLFYKTVRSPELIFDLSIAIGRLCNGAPMYSRQFKYLEKIRDKFYEQNSQEDMLEYIIDYSKEHDDKEHLWSARSIKKHGLPKIEACYIEAKKNFDDESTVCQYFLTTAHTSKGLEWDKVMLENDFPNVTYLIARWIVKDHIAVQGRKFMYIFKQYLDKGEVEQSLIDEFNLFYVAITRGKVNVELDNDSIHIMDLEQSDLDDLIGIHYDALMEEDIKGRQVAEFGG